MDDIKSTLNSSELSEKADVKQSGNVEGLNVRGRIYKRDY